LRVISFKLQVTRKPIKCIEKNEIKRLTSVYFLCIIELRSSNYENQRFDKALREERMEV